MENISSGETSLNLPPIIFGTSCLGNLYRELPWETKLGIAREWFNALSVPAIDSAGKYGAGLALECIGKALRELGKKPGDLFISNKLGWRRVPLTGPEPTFEPGAWANLEYDAVQDISYDGILRCYREGLELIGGGFGFDMVSVHDPDEYLAAGGDEQDILDAYKALFELKDAGEVKAVGVGTKDWRVAKQLHEKINFDWIMLACAPTILVHPPELITFMKELEAEGTTIISSAVFNGGFLLGSNMLDYREADPVKDAAMFEGREKFFAKCEKFGVEPAAAAVEFTMRLPGVKACALNTSKPERVCSNAKYGTHKSPEEFWSTRHFDWSSS